MIKLFTEFKLRSMTDAAFDLYRRELEEFIKKQPEPLPSQYNAALLTLDLVADYRKTWQFRRAAFINFITDAETSVDQLQKTETASRQRLREKISREERGEYIDRLALVRGEINRRNGSKQ